MNKTRLSAYLLAAIATTPASVQDVPKTNQVIPFTRYFEKDIRYRNYQNLATHCCKGCLHNALPTRTTNENRRQN